MPESKADADIVFTTRLTKDDWDPEFKAWRCPALAIPKAQVGDLFVEGDRIDKEKYQVLEGRPPSIRWIPEEPPTRLAAQIRLSESLSLEAETDWWKKLAIVLPVVASIVVALIGGIASYLSKPAAVTADASAAIGTELLRATLTEFDSNETAQLISFTVAVNPLDRAKFIKKSEQDNFMLVVGVRARSAISDLEGKYEYAYGPYPFDSASPRAPTADDNLRAIIATHCVDFVLFRVASARFAALPFQLPFVPNNYGSDLKILESRSEGTACP